MRTRARCTSWPSAELFKPTSPLDTLKRWRCQLQPLVLWSLAPNWAIFAIVHASGEVRGNSFYSLVLLKPHENLFIRLDVTEQILAYTGFRLRLLS